MKAAAAKSLSELRYRRLFEAAHDGILLIDPVTRKVIDVNPFLVEFLGYAREELIGKELFEFGLLKDAAASQAAFRKLQTEDFIRYEDLPLQTKFGRRVDVEFISNLYQEGEQSIIQCNVRDITARKGTEGALRVAEARLTKHAAELEQLVGQRTSELRAINAQLETFVYSIAHDLRAPLRTMQGFAQLLVEEHASGLDAHGQKFANFINKSAQTMDLLLSDLLTFSHLSNQVMELMPVALNEVMQDALTGWEDRIRDRVIRIDNIEVWPVVLAHATTLRQVLVNLINNALKFSVPDTAPIVRLRSELRRDGIVRIWVEDNGIGIDAEFQERIFQVFERLHTTQYPGTGIGLAIVRKGVERMHGQPGVESSIGGGSAFWIDLPSAPNNANKEAIA